MARKTRSETELHWREMMNRQAGSGLSVRCLFCPKLFGRLEEPAILTDGRRIEV